MGPLEQRITRAATLEPADLDLAVQRFVDLFSSLTERDLPQKVAAVYAEGAYLNDNLKEVEGVEAILHYLRESGEAVVSCKVQVEDLSVSGRSCYVRWTMDIFFKKLKKGQRCRSQGISHLLLDSDGKILYHQDYWDAAAGLFQHIPVLGFLIRAIRKRL